MPHLDSLIVAHRDREHLPGRTSRQRALRDEGGVEREHHAVGHHHLGVAGEGHRRLVEARLGHLGACRAEAV